MNQNTVNPLYGQPVVVQPPMITPVPVPVQNNNEPMIDPKIFKTHPVAIKCQFCKRPMTTKVTKQFNLCACLLCYCTGIGFYVCVQACRGKDLCCFDAEHRCPFCDNVAGTYIAC